MLVITVSIATYKSVNLVRFFEQQGHHLSIILSKSATTKY
jgi:phosphopantothenoylcysteine synthetase/decarboxylase